MKPCWPDTFQSFAACPWCADGGGLHIRREAANTLKNKSLTTDKGQIDWLWWSGTDVSELRRLWAFCSSPDDLRCGPWMIILTAANSQLIYQSALAAPSTVPAVLSAETSLAATSTVWFPAIWDVSGASGRWAKEMIIYYIRPRGTFKSYFTCRKILRHGTSGFISHPKGRFAADFYCP
jgi:hypothetical protein